MRKIKMGLMAMAAITGIGSAFAFNHPHKVAGATYYGYRINSTTVGWATSPPQFTNCQSDSQALACTITSTAPQATVLATTNEYPPSTGEKSHVGDLYK
ncbi:MAG: hypothetical protein M3O71_10175 [Bacteroidota bacterium]|nr:hypothetical protein [Bacteroidota bacterium]